jgi:hypothetical protein
MGGGGGGVICQSECFISKTNKKFFFKFYNGVYNKRYPRNLILVRICHQYIYTGLNHTLGPT